ncbi:PREDICTED: MATH domain and coiled-coil domain-containing protein At3g58380 [Camelina sativa]|uniref:MATH domain and coiled-coil domain-containing protein At3g58380 n=1 Tax=Camelina sativa TaxID=90675 RepID=A0ABM0TU41_CAMSA|nr:PREDICTED: MATH domain and coiled-coil domain-containing protein At3g58380 [Camelina sativa]
MGKQQVEKKFVWIIKNLPVLKPKQTHSDPFLIAGSRWRLLAIPNGTNFEFSYQYMGVADCSQSLTSTWRRHVKVRLTIVNGIYQKRSSVRVSDLYFDDEKPPTCPYPIVPPPPFNLLARDAGFLVSGQVTILIEVVALKTMGTSPGESDKDGAMSYNLLNKTQELKESIDVNGFQILPSQVESVKRIFERYPDIASQVRLKKRSLRTTYMNVLLGIVETLCQLPAEISDDDLDEASAAVSDVAQGGFKVDWLEKKLEEVKEKKKNVDIGKSCLQKVERTLKFFIEKANVPLSFDDVV